MVAGRRVVVTGKIAGESRETAEAKLREAGAIVQSAVGKNTDLLITGARVGASKLAKAQALGVMVIPWEQAFGTNPTIGVVPPRQPVPDVRVWAPMLAKAGELPSDGEKWLYEVKWDGYRGIATVKGGAVMLQSRSGKSDLTGQFPEVVAELATFDDCVLDGELVAIDAAGESTFETLHRSQGSSATRFIVFDVLEAKGSRVTGMTLTARRELLEQLLDEHELSHVAVSPAFPDGKRLMEVVMARGLEGIVAKRRASLYQEGSRTDAWTKVKVRIGQEFVVVGYTPGEGALEGLPGALVLGVLDGDPKELVYCGKVGTGLTDEDRRLLLDAMDERTACGTNLCPVTIGEKQQKELVRDGVTWVEPQIVVQVEFQRWTEDSVLWHPSFKGVRDDKAPADVRREAVTASR